MSKTTRISNRIKRIEDRFKIKVSKGRKGTDMDIEIHERRIDKLRGKHREETIKQEKNMPESPLGFIMPYNTTKRVKNIMNTAIDTHWKSEEDAWRKSGKGNVPSGTYAVYDRGRFEPDGKGGGSYPEETPKLRTRYNTPAYDNETQSEGVSTYKNWKNKK